MDPSHYLTPHWRIHRKQQKIPHHVCIVYLAKPALPQYALITFAPVLFGTDAAVLFFSLQMQSVSQTQ